MSFNSGSPVALTNGQTYLCPTQSHNEGCSAISDSSGSLLFYSNGETIWNKNHQIMPNGTGLLGGISSTQSSIIVPLPLSNRYYYVFTIGAWFTCGGGGSLSNGCGYSVVDICADSSRGDVIPAVKNIQLLDSTTEKIAVSKHSNNIDYWILTHRFASNKFYAFRLTPEGITDTVISAIGAPHTGAKPHSMGQLKFSSNGQKIAIGTAHGGLGPPYDSLELLEVFDFNSSTGSVTNAQSLRIPNSSFSVYGVEFSNDGSKLYIEGTPLTVPWQNFIYQYDLNAGGGNLDSINASQNVVANPLGTSEYKGLQIGPDNKIYLVSNSNPAFLSVINNPNILGVGCNYQDAQISLAGNSGSFSLPSFIAGYNYSNTIADCSINGFSENVQNDIPTIYPNPFSTQLTFTFADKVQTTIILYDFLGQRVLQQAFTNSTTINTTQLADGIYFYELRNDKGAIKNGKVLKQ